jgi:hypothetical protein
MADVAQEMRRHVLHNLDGIQSALLVSRNSTKLPTGYQKFELVLTTLSGCRQSIERAEGQEQIIEILRGASRKLGLWEAGLTETAVKRARLAIDEMVGDLEAKESAA